MIKDKLNENVKVKPNSFFLNELKQKLPEFFTANKFDEEGNIIEEAKFDLNKFQQALREKNIEELSNGYQLTFIGKDYAKKQAGETSLTVMVPDNKHNQKSENKNSKNLFFTGDNLEVLRHLQNNYINSIDVIYIDPPYNTGSDGFVYPDKFEYSDQSLKDMFSLNEDELAKLKSIQEKSTHSAWLTFMYPRLRLSKYLLKESGVIFVSIDENEQANLKLLMDEIFGEGSFVASLGWQKVYSPKNQAKYFSNDYEFILVYAKNISNFTVSELPRTAEMNARYKNTDGDPRGDWKPGDTVGNGERKNGYYDVHGPTGKIFNVPQGKHWVYAPETMKKMIEDNRIWFGKDGSSFPAVKQFLSEVSGRKASSFLPYSEYGHTDMAIKDIKKIFSDFDKPPFDTPKPVKLIKNVLKFQNNKKLTVLDFFAGSGTTAQAVMELNAEDEGTRKYIMIQIDESLSESSSAYNGGFRSIDEISRERIMRASKRIQDKSGLVIPENFDGKRQIAHT